MTMGWALWAFSGTCPDPNGLVLILINEFGTYLIIFLKSGTDLGQVWVLPCLVRLYIKLKILK